MPSGALKNFQLNLLRSELSSLAILPPPPPDPESKYENNND